MKIGSEKNLFEYCNFFMPGRVLYFHDSHDFGGMELYMYRLIRNLNPQRYSPAVMVAGYTDPYRSSPDRVRNDLQKAGIPVIRPPDPGAISGYRSLKEIYTVARMLRSFKPDIFHIHTCRPEGARKVTLAARLAGIRGVIRSEHFPPSVTMRSKTKYLVKPFDWLTSYIVTGSEGDRQEQIQLLARPADKVVRIYNSVEAQRFAPDQDVRAAKKKLGLDPDIPVISTVGRLVPQKGHCYLIEALEQVVHQFGPVNLLLVGDGELRAQLEDRVRGLKIKPYVHFLGFQEDVLPYMQAADIAVMPSLYEVFSLAMLEFMALGKPIVTSDHSSFREAITDGEHGLIVPMKDSRALADAILVLLRDEALRVRLGSTASKHVRENFSFDQLAQKMMDLYDRVLDYKV